MFVVQNMGDRLLKQQMKMRVERLQRKPSASEACEVVEQRVGQDMRAIVGNYNACVCMRAYTY